MAALELLVAVPLVGAAASVVSGFRSPRAPRVVALATTLLYAGILIAAIPPGGFSGTAIEGLEVTSTTPFWALRLDGLSVPLVAITSLLTIVAVLTSWGVTEKPGAHHALLLAWQGTLAGVFLAADIVLLYVFWEAVLIPMYFLIGLWGHENRRQVAMKFFIYQFAGGALVLVGILMLVFQTGMTDIAGILGATDTLTHPALVFWLLTAGMLVLLPAVPLHGWSPDAHVEAPTAASLLHAGVLLKLGGYGLLRLVLPVSPATFESARWVFLVLGIVGIVYGAAVALVQSDLKRLVAFSSISHMGFVLFAMSAGTANGLAAAMLIMVSHGLTSPLLFVLVGQLYERAHTREIARFGGMGRTIPRWGAALTFGALAGLGLPGLSGFPGEFLAVLETFGKWSWWITPVAVGFVLVAAYNLRAVRDVVHGDVVEEWHGMKDLAAGDFVPLAALSLPIIAVGVWPALVLTISGPVYANLAAVLERGM